MPIAEAPDRPAPAVMRLGWRARWRAIAADLLVFDRHRLAWPLATRTMVGLLAPLLLAKLLDAPYLVWVGIGAYLVAIGDSLDDGDRAQPLRLVVGTVLGALALATGVLAGGDLLTAVAGMLVWGVLAGLMGVYGSAFAVVALPVAWAYVELGLPGRDHSLAQALSLGAAYLLGGGFTLLLTFAFRLGGPHARTKTQVAIAYRELADYLERIAAAEDAGGAWPGHSPVAAETPVRVAIAEARRVAAQGWANQQGPSRANQRLMVLIETADRLFALFAIKREMPGGPGLAFFAETCRTVATALVRRPAPARLRPRLEELYRLAEAPANATGFGVAAVDRRIAGELAHAVLVVAGDAPPPGAPAPAPAPKITLTQLLEPLAACLDPRSVVARHALRFAVVAAAAVVVFWVFPPPFGYWVPLTVTVVLKPYAGMTLARTVQRIVGTVAGILVGMALMPLLPGQWAQGAAMAIAFFCMMAVLPFNYSLVVLFLSAGLIPFEHVLDPGITLDVGLLRIAATLIGAMLAVVGGHLLWPSFERNELATMLRAAVRSMGGYMEAGLRSVETGQGADVAEAARQQAGLDLSNLQAALLRSLSEVGGDPARMQGLVGASAALQRLMLNLNAVRQAAPAPAPVALAPVRAPLAAAFGEICEGRTVALAAFAALRAAVPAVDAGSPPSAHFLVREIDRMIAQTEMLSVAVGDLTPPPDAPASCQAMTLAETGSRTKR